jgi:hypothetical protein
VCPHVFVQLRPNHKTTALSPVPVCPQIAKLPLPRIPNPRRNVSRLPFPDSSPRSPAQSLARSSIAAPTTASAFLQASLSKMPRSKFSLPQHPAPRHFRSRLTTTRPSEEKRVDARMLSPSNRRVPMNKSRGTCWALLLLPCFCSTHAVPFSPSLYLPSADRPPKFCEVNHSLLPTVSRRSAHG